MVGNLVTGKLGVIQYEIMPNSWQVEIARKRLLQELTSLVDIQSYQDVLTPEEITSLGHFMNNYIRLVVSTPSIHPLEDVSETAWDGFVEWFCGDRRNVKAAWEGYIALPYFIQSDWLQAWQQGVENILPSKIKHPSLLTSEEKDELLERDSPLPPSAANG